MTFQFKRSTSPHPRWEIDYKTLRFVTNRINIETGLDLTMMKAQAIMLAIEKCPLEDE